AQALDAQAVRRVAHGHLHPFDGAEFEALEHLIARARHITTEMAVGAEPRRGRYADVRIRTVWIPFSRYDLGAGNLDDLAAARLEMDARPRRDDAPKVEHHRYVAPRYGFDDAVSTFEAQQLLGRTHGAFVKGRKRLGVDTFLELEVGIGLLGLDPN